jgi:membrane associated rhomboid family serine protease
MRRIDFSFTWAIIIANGLIFMFAQLLGTMGSSSLPLVLLGANSPILILDGEVWRFMTSGFLHTNLLHFALNMYALWALGGFVERFYSKRKFLVVYLGGILAGSLVSFLVDIVSIFSGGGGVTLAGGAGLIGYIFSLGASGGIFALLGLVIGTSFFVHNAPDLPIDRNQLLFIGGLNLLFGFAFPGVDNAAHIGGLLMGLVFSQVAMPYSDTFSSNWQKGLLKFSSVALFCILGCSFLLQVLSSTLLILGS